MKHAHPYETQGKTLSRVYLSHHVWEAETRIPDNSKMFNFDIEVPAQESVPAQSFLILDPYGNESMSGDQLNRLTGSEGRFALAIDRLKGYVYYAHFKTEKVGGKSLTVVVFSRPGDFYSGKDESYKVPKAYLKKLDDLKSAKRPFNITCRDTTLWSFMDQESHWGDLRENLVVELNFPGQTLQIWGSSHRTVGYWK